MDKKIAEILLRQTEKSIEECKSQLTDLNKAKQELLTEINNSLSTGIKTLRKRLPKGVPRRYILSTIKTFKKITTRDILDKIKDEYDVELRDSTIRRVLSKLEEENTIRYDDEGYWNYIEKSKDDDLPY